MQKRQQNGLWITNVTLLLSAVMAVKGLKGTSGKEALWFLPFFLSLPYHSPSSTRTSLSLSLSLSHNQGTKNNPSELVFYIFITMGINLRKTKF